MIIQNWENIVSFLQNKLIFQKKIYLEITSALYRSGM